PLSVFQFAQENVLLLLSVCILLCQLGLVSAVTRGMILAIVAFFGFHIASTVGIMNQWSRFIMPAAPLAMLLALQGLQLALTAGDSSLDDKDVRRRMASPIFAGVLLGLLAMRVPQAVVLHGNDVRLKMTTGSYANERAVLLAVAEY